MPQSASLSLNTKRTLGEISPLIFGGFAEHLGRCIYEGIYEPGSPLADEQGLRRDVLEALREINFRVMRYPGGNFVSGYRWTDGIGPQAERPRRRELAWRSVETNQFGPDEFMRFARAVGTEPMWAVNLGTGTIQEAADLVEYLNLPTGTHWSDQRARNGNRDPYSVKYFCLGNEMDGPWQIGHMDAATYADKAVEAAKLMRLMDPDIQTIACGSSNTGMPSYPDWDQTVLERAWDAMDYLSLHYYAGNRDGDHASYLASSVQFESHVDTLAAAVRLVGAKRRSNKQIKLSWDEWNVWYRERGENGDWNEAPHILEEVYNLEDALVVAQWLSTFLRRADVVKMACIAQIVNVIAPIMTRPDALFKQSIFYPLMLFSRYAAGVSLDGLVQAPTIDTKVYGGVPAVDASASFEAASGQGALFVVNRSLTDALDFTVRWEDTAPAEVTGAWQLSGTDPRLANSFEQPGQVVARPVEPPALDGGQLRLSLPPLSFTTLTVRY